MTITHPALVITVDGTSGVGKGAVSRFLARELKWHLLDSGALYRALALRVQASGIAGDDKNAIASLASTLTLHCSANAERFFLEGRDVSEAIRSEQCGILASQLAVFGEVREALRQHHLAFRQPPGLVADGRDMGSVVFPDAVIKFFLAAHPKERAQRRLKQLRNLGIDANLSELVEQMAARDERDSSRKVAPLLPAAGSIVLDTTHLSLAMVVSKVREVVLSTGGLSIA